MGLLGEHAIRGVQGSLLLRCQRRLEHGELISDLQHLEVLGTAHLGRLDIHAVMGQESIHTPSSSSVPTRVNRGYARYVAASSGGNAVSMTPFRPSITSHRTPSPSATTVG